MLFGTRRKPENSYWVDPRYTPAAETQRAWSIVRDPAMGSKSRDILTVLGGIAASLVVLGACAYAELAAHFGHEGLVLGTTAGAATLIYGYIRLNNWAKSHASRENPAEAKKK